MSFADRPPHSLADLLSRYLARQAAARAEGFAGAESAGEVVPHEAVPVQPVDPRLAWDEGLAAARYYGGLSEKCQAPPDWASLVSSQEPVTALPLCLGNYPQMVRDLHSLLHAAETAAPPATARPPAAPTSVEWAARVARGKAYPQALLGLAVLRLAKEFDQADALAEELERDCPSEWRAGLANERAALAWQRGRREEAAARWQSQPASVPVLFNRGVAALFLGRRDEARAWLAQAVGQLPEETGWHHLGRLYLALAEVADQAR